MKFRGLPPGGMMFATRPSIPKEMNHGRHRRPRSPTPPPPGGMMFATRPSIPKEMNHGRHRRPRSPTLHPAGVYDGCLLAGIIFSTPEGAMVCSPVCQHWVAEKPPQAINPQKPSNSPVGATGENTSTLLHRR